MKKPLTEEFKLNPLDSSREVFAMYEYMFMPSMDYDARNEESAENFGKPGRDVDNVIESMSHLFTPQWKEKMAEVDLFMRWEQIVGEFNAMKCYVVSLRDGVLTLGTYNPAFATHLKFMKDEIARKIENYNPGLKITEVILVGNKQSRLMH